MKEISVFDVIGPKMIGPSSSHTAGAVRIARVVNRMLDEPVRQARLHLYGSFAMTYRGHGTDRALVVGLLGMGTEDLRIRDAFEYAQRAGLSFTFLPDPEKKVKDSNTVEIEAASASGRSVQLVGVSTGGGNFRIDEIGGVQVSFTGEYHTLIIRQKDQPGIVKHISTCLSDSGINIAFMKLYREEKGKNAYTIVEADEPIDRAVLEKLREHRAILDVSLVEP